MVLDLVILGLVITLSPLTLVAFILLLAEQRQPTGPGPLVGARLDLSQHGAAGRGEPGAVARGEQAAALQRLRRGCPVLGRPAAHLPDQRVGEPALRNLQQVRLQPAYPLADQGRDVPVAAVFPQGGGQLPEPAERVAGTGPSGAARNAK